jgi:hypothetical protein
MYAWNTDVMKRDVACYACLVAQRVSSTVVVFVVVALARQQIMYVTSTVVGMSPAVHVQRMKSCTYVANIAAPIASSVLSVLVIIALYAMLRRMISICIVLHTGVRSVDAPTRAGR